MKPAKIVLLCGIGSIGLAAPVYAQNQSVPSDAGTSRAANQADTAAAPPSAVPSSTPGDIIVTARRINERLQDVPVAVSVLTPAVIESKGVFAPVDLSKNTPGLSVTASVSDRNNITYTIRGQGYAYATLFPAVITYFDEVPITQLSPGQFFDLANVQVLRGPQGVNFGRVTDGGNVMVTPQGAKNDFGGYVGAKLGDYSLRSFNGAINVPLIADKILFRGAFEIARRDGFTQNLGSGQTLDNVRYESYRGTLTLKPTDTLRNDTVVSYQHTHDNGTSVVPIGINAPALAANVGGLAAFFGSLYGIDARGNVVPNAPGLTPFTAANFIASYNAQLAAQAARGPRKVFYDDPSFDRRKNLFIVNTTTADLTDTIQLKNIFGYINVKDDEASNFTGVNGKGILTCHSACVGQGGNGNGGLPFNWQEQFSEELRLSGKSFDGAFTWATGIYADEQRPGGKFENDTINVGILERDNVQYATTTSHAFYANGEIEVAPRLKINGGIRYTQDKLDSYNVTYLRPIYYPGVFAPMPHGECTTYAGPLGTVNCQHINSKFNVWTWSIGASYKLEDGPLFYAKASKGYRPGGTQGSVAIGVDPRYNPEYDISVELGMKGEFRLGDEARLTANLALYRDRYTNIQKLISLTGPGGAPVSLITNAANAVIKGVEFDSTLTPFRGFSLGGTLAYTDAKYDRGGYVPGGATDPCNTNSVSVLGFCPFNRFNFTPKFQYTLNASYDLPVDESVGKITISGNWYHQSSIAMSDTSALAVHSIQGPYGLLDMNVTWSNVMRHPVDVGFFVTNLTNTTYEVGIQDLAYRSTFGTLAYIYGAPRMFGFSLKYRFGADAR